LRAAGALKGARLELEEQMAATAMGAKIDAPAVGNLDGPQIVRGGLRGDEGRGMAGDVFAKASSTPWGWMAPGMWIGSRSQPARPER
jgi:hypothetical protein